MTALDYPRLQITALSAIALLGSVFLLAWRRQRWAKIYLALLAIALAYQSFILMPYLLPIPPQAPNREVSDPAKSFSLMVANVLMENEEVEPYLRLVEQHNPDVVLVIEPNERWTEQLAPLREQYEHRMEQPQENHYGMNLYSRLALHNAEVNYFEKEGVPSIRAEVELPSGERVLLYAIHPRPPLPENSVEAADKELIQVANLAKEADLPVVVAGDFNDVPWSFTMTEFQKIGDLRDIRIGRGLYNTFDAKNPILRLPIDHIFISPGLGLAEINSPMAFSSDHYAWLVTLVVDETIQ